MWRVLAVCALPSRANSGRGEIGSRLAVMTITYRSAGETVKGSCVCPADRWKRRPETPWETPAEDGCEGDVMLNAFESSASGSLAGGQTLLLSAADALSRLSGLPLARQQGIWMGRQASESPSASFSAQAAGSTGAVRCAGAVGACGAGEDCLGSSQGHTGAGEDCGGGHGCCGGEKHGAGHRCCGAGGHHAGSAHGHCGSGGDCGGHGHEEHRAGHGCCGGREEKHAAGRGCCGGGECAGR